MGQRRKEHFFLALLRALMTGGELMEDNRTFREVVKEWASGGLFFYWHYFFRPILMGILGLLCIPILILKQWRWIIGIFVAIMILLPVAGPFIYAWLK